MVRISLAKLTTSITAYESMLFAETFTALSPEGVRVSGAFPSLMYRCTEGLGHGNLVTHRAVGF